MQKIQVRRGSKANLPTLDVGEFGLCTDTGELFIGGLTGNIQITVTLPLNSGGVSSSFPTVNKTVVVIMENHSASALDGSSSAPYFNKLLSEGVNFKQMFALTHPSEPNYFMLFAGQDMGGDSRLYADTWVGSEYTATNLYTALNAVGKNFIGYAENMPSDGYTGQDSGEYADRHNPWKSFQNVPSTSNLVFENHFNNNTSDYSALPDVSFVVPNLINDIHDGTINDGDNWLKNNIDPYYQWAKANNSILIITFDEDEDTGGNNNIPFVIAGSSNVIKQSTINNTTYNHYDVLRTLIGLYGGTDFPANSSTAKDITDCWGTGSVADTVAPTVSISPSAGTFTSAQSVMLTGSDNSGGAVTIYYTTDGSTPTYPISGTTQTYSTSIAVSATETIKYIGRDTAGNISAVQSATYTINTTNVLVSDDFTRGTLPASSLGTPNNYAGGSLSPIPVWQFLGTTGSYGIDANGQAYASSVATSGHNVEIVDVGISDFTIECQFAVIGSGENPKIAIRAQDQENMLLFTYSDASGGILYSYTNGNDDTPLFTWNGTMVNTDIIKITTQGSNVTVYKNGAQIISVSNATKYQTATKCGIMAYHYPNSRFDNFKVTA